MRAAASRGAGASAFFFGNSQDSHRQGPAGVSLRTAMRSDDFRGGRPAWSVTMGGAPDGRGAARGRPTETRSVGPPLRAKDVDRATSGRTWAAGPVRGPMA